LGGSVVHQSATQGITGQAYQASGGFPSQGLANKIGTLTRLCVTSEKMGANDRRKTLVEHKMGCGCKVLPKTGKKKKKPLAPAGKKSGDAS